MIIGVYHPTTTTTGILLFGMPQIQIQLAPTTSQLNTRNVMKLELITKVNQPCYETKRVE